MPSHTLDLPERTDLPYFAYGLFKPGELAYGQIESWVEGVPIEARVSGALYVRDGLPLLKCGELNSVLGHLLYFREGKAEEAYASICAFEPRKHYRWRRVTSHTGEVANALVGITPERGSIHNEEGVWSGRQDPVFVTGLSVVREVTYQHSREAFPPAPPNRFDWPRLFQLQMAYLLLWTIIERYTSLSYGPTLKPEEKVRKFGQDPAFKQALERVVTRKDKVYDSQDPEIPPAILDPKHPASSAEYYRRVRHNLTHRGKGTWRDGEIIRNSLRELQEVTGLVLERRIAAETGLCDFR